MAVIETFNIKGCKVSIADDYMAKTKEENEVYLRELTEVARKILFEIEKEKNKKLKEIKL